MVAEIQGANANVSGGGALAGAGGLLGGRFGGLIGGIRSQKLEATAVLSITNVRTTETIATEDGYAAKNNLSFGAGGFFAAAGAVGGGYDNTEIGRIVTLSFIQANSNLVNGLGLIQPGAADTAEAAPTKIYTTQGAVAMRVSSVATAKTLRTLPSGSVLYPTCNNAGRPVLMPDRPCCCYHALVPGRRIPFVSWRAVAAGRPVTD